jgi:hypothetical protein
MRVAEEILCIFPSWFPANLRCSCSENALKYMRFGILTVLCYSSLMISPQQYDVTEIYLSKLRLNTSDLCRIILILDAYHSDGLWAVRPGFGSRQEQEMFLYSTEFRPALRATQPHIQLEPGTLSPGVKRPGREADHSPPSSAEVKNGTAIPPLPYTSLWRGT